MKRYNDKYEVRNLMDTYSQAGMPFVFVIDFEFQKMICHPLEGLPDSIHFRIGQCNKNPVFTDFISGPSPISIDKLIDKEKYLRAFRICQEHLLVGNSYLINLAFPTKIKMDVSMRQIYEHSLAHYNLLIEDEFICFSPETFVKIKGDQISSYPIKGSLDARLPSAMSTLLNDQKEHAEHATIVDLIRNDLSRVARKVKVATFKKIRKIETSKGPYLQMASTIVGTLNEDLRQKIGSLIFELLPAGSITGAPKKKTVEIIQEAEEIDRGYYTGVFGVFDGENLDSSVLIRCIERKNKDFYFRSGGGVTFKSEPYKEYEELIRKIYVPIHRKHTIARRPNAIASIS